MNEPRFREILRRLADADVDSVVVGLASAVIQGAPLSTMDLDIVHRRTPDNVARLMQVLEELEAVYRTDRRRLRPQASVLLGKGHNLFETRFGDFDCLCTIDDGLGYEELEPDSLLIDLGDNLHCRVLSLARLIEIKRRAGRPKDLAALPALEGTLDEIRKRGGS